MAPSGDKNYLGNMWSVDQMSTAGLNPNLSVSGGWACALGGGNDNDYMCRFGGTSGACPIVAGVASLLLSKDSTLTAGQVVNILKGSAQRNLGGGLVISPPDTAYGYGRVDAFRALLSISHGDCDNSGSIDAGDLTLLVDHLFINFTPLFPSELLGDVSCDGTVGVEDLTALVDFLFISFTPPTSPCFAY